MARPNKQGVDYFPLDVHLDDKFKFIEIKYKLEGFAVVIKLLQKIYSYGYWYKWTEDVSYLFADEIRADPQLVQNVVEECIKRDIFDAQLYEKYSILTSSGIQKRFKEIVRRRKDVEVITDYLLIDGIFGVNDDIKPTSSRQDDVKSTQSKVKETESKLNKTDKKLKQTKLTDKESTEKTVSRSVSSVLNPSFAELAKFYESNIGPLVPAIGEELDYLLQEYLDVDLIIAAFKLSISVGSRNKLKYTQGTLRNWKQEHVTTVDQLKNKTEREKKQYQHKNSTRSGSVLEPSQETLERSKREEEEFQRKVASGEINLEELEEKANEMFATGT